MRAPREQRRFHRVALDLPVVFATRGSSAKIPGVALDISIGGMFVQTALPASFGALVVVELRLSQTTPAVTLPGVVRWVTARGMGLHFESLGARETHAITELGREAAGGRRQ